MGWKKGRLAMIDRQWTGHSATLYRKGELIQAEKARRNRLPNEQNSKRGQVTMTRVGKALTALGESIQERYADSTPGGVAEEKHARQQNY
jgi:hypothetical protein